MRGSSWTEQPEQASAALLAVDTVCAEPSASAVTSERDAGEEAGQAPQCDQGVAEVLDAPPLAIKKSLKVNVCPSPTEIHEFSRNSSEWVHLFTDLWWKTLAAPPPSDDAEMTPRTRPAAVAIDVHGNDAKAEAVDEAPLDIDQVNPNSLSLVSVGGAPGEGVAAREERPLEEIMDSFLAGAIIAFPTKDDSHLQQRTNLKHQDMIDLRRWGFVGPKTLNQHKLLDW